MAQAGWEALEELLSLSCPPSYNQTVGTCCSHGLCHPCLLLEPVQGSWDSGRVRGELMGQRWFPGSLMGLGKKTPNTMERAG